MTGPRFKVAGIHLVARLVSSDTVDIEVVCPRGGLIRYGLTVARGDGKDSEAGTIRELPPLGSTIVFEEDPDGGPGHEIEIGDVIYRIITVDDILLAIILPQRRSDRASTRG